MLPTAGPSTPATLNLCRCGGKEASICTCGHDRAPPLSASGNGGLAALAQAAMFCCGNDAPSIALPTPAASTPVVMTAHTQSNVPVVEEDKSRKHPRGCCSSPPSSRPPSPKPKRSKHASHVRAPASSSKDRGLPSLPVPPLFAPLEQSLSSGSVAPPAFPPIPPISTISSMTSFAPPECCCGTACACPGCLKHRGQAHASKDFEDCSEGTCGICVDHEGGIELPEAAFAASHGGIASSSSGCHQGHSSNPSAQSSLSAPAHLAGAAATQKSPTTSTSFIDAFFAKAAALPPPPPKHMRPGALDPTNVLVYPPDLFAGDARRRKAFGLVEVPKLECNCPGGCGCPEGRCGCGDNCGGCAPVHTGENDAERSPAESARTETVRVSAKIPGGSCCG
ncbi:hypothetical protein OH77DRAFT_634166 [Trametes cingulata]|nr:hypothetical protein OH77DRAFT_634166 [Trametes cingulata]